MASPWFTPGASTASWFAQPPGNPAAAASTSPQPSSGYSPALGQMFGQQTEPAQPSSAPAGIAPVQSPAQDESGGFQLSPYVMQGINDQALPQLPTDTVQNVIQRDASILGPYYNQNGPASGRGSSGSGGVGRYLEGLQKTDPAAYAQAQQSQQTALTSLLKSVGELQKRGVSNDVIGNLVGNSWNDVKWSGIGDISKLADPSMADRLARDPDARNGLAGGPLWSMLAKVYGPNEWYGQGTSMASRSPTDYYNTLNQYGITPPPLNYGAIRAQDAAATAEQQRQADYTQIGTGPSWMNAP